jgi:arsenate reductase
MKKYKVAFICVHNSCRSQMAEAISKLLASDTFETYSAGTHIKNQINQDAVKVIKDIYHVDMEETQKSKLIDLLPDIDIIVTMGCEVECPYLPSLHREDWGLDDPTGKPIEVFIETAKLIESKVIDLVNRVKNGLILLSKEII